MMRNVVVILLLITVILATVPAHAEVKGRGISKVVEDATYTDPYTIKFVYVPLTYGDADAFLSPVLATMNWDGYAAILSLLILHHSAIIDDNGNEVLEYVDDVAGGIYNEENSLCDSGLGICYNYDVIDTYKNLKTYITATITQEYTFYVEASTEAEAEAKVGADLGIVAVSFNIKSTVRVGNMYKVTATATVYRYLSYMMYEAKITETFVNYRTGERVVLNEINVEASPEYSYIAPPPG